MIVISAHTPDGDYPKLAEALKASCERFGLRWNVFECNQQPSWLETVQLKPVWILSKLLEAREAVLWLDADCEIVKLPNLLLGTGHDFAAFNNCVDPAQTFGYDPRRLHVSGGVLYFGYTAAAIELLVRWQAEVGSRPDPRGTDPSLDAVYNQHHPPVNALWLPRSYNRHEKEWPEIEPVINHKFINRRHSSAADAGGEPLVTSPFGTMFHYRDVYDMVVEQAPAEQASTFVEIGCWLGESSSHMARRIKETAKPIRFYCVDTWRGSEGIDWMKPVIERCGGDMLPAWRKRLQKDGVAAYAAPIQKPSVEAAGKFADGSIDFLMIDGDHRYEAVKADIAAWMPKMKTGALMAGDDFDEQSHPDVPRAVREIFGDDFTLMGRTWLHRIE